MPLDSYYLRFGGYGDGGDFSLLADYRVAQLLRRTTTPQETVYIYGGEALVLFRNMIHQFANLLTLRG